MSEETNDERLDDFAESAYDETNDFGFNSDPSDDERGPSERTGHSEERANDDVYDPILDDDPDSEWDFVGYEYDDVDNDDFDEDFDEDFETLSDAEFDELIDGEDEEEDEETLDGASDAAPSEDEFGDEFDDMNADEDEFVDESDDEI